MEMPTENKARTQASTDGAVEFSSTVGAVSFRGIALLGLENDHGITSEFVFDQAPIMTDRSRRGEENQGGVTYEAVHCRSTLEGQSLEYLRTESVSLKRHTNMAFQICPG